MLNIPLNPESDLLPSCGVSRGTTISVGLPPTQNSATRCEQFGFDLNHLGMNEAKEKGLVSKAGLSLIAVPLEKSHGHRVQVTQGHPPDSG